MSNLLQDLRLHSEHNRKSEWPYNLLSAAADEIDRLSLKLDEQSCDARNALSRLGECEERFQAGRDAWEMLEKSVADLNALPGAREMRDALTGIMLVAPDLSDTEWAKEAAARVVETSAQNANPLRACLDPTCDKPHPSE
jgi:DNA repair ATPase RecN